MSEEMTLSNNEQSLQLKHHKRHRLLSRIALVSGIVALGFVAYLVSTQMSLIRFAVTTQGTEVRIVQDGVSVWYRVHFGKLVTLESAPGYERASVHVIEAAPFGVGTDVAVLAQIPGQEGIVLGRIREGVYEEIVSDGSAKSDLYVRPDGMALFTRTRDGESRLMQIDLQKGADSLVDRGRGRSPRLFSDGFFVALSAQGLVRIDPALHEVEVLIPHTDADILPSTLSATGFLASMSNYSGKTLFYRIHTTSPAKISLLHTEEQFLETPLVLLTDRYTMAFNENSTAVIYEFSQGIFSTVKTISIRL